MGRSLFTHLVILQAVGLAVVAWAGTDRDKGDRSPAGLARLEARMAAQVDIRGLLTCALPEKNTGGACALQLVNEDTGEALNIAGGGAAMRLFQAGKTQVMATGFISGDTLRIIDITGK